MLSELPSAASASRFQPRVLTVRLSGLQQGLCWHNLEPSALARPCNNHPPPTRTCRLADASPINENLKFAH